MNIDSLLLKLSSLNLEMANPYHFSILLSGGTDSTGSGSGEGEECSREGAWAAVAGELSGGHASLPSAGEVTAACLSGTGESQAGDPRGRTTEVGEI